MPFWRIRTDDRQSGVGLLQHVSSISVRTFLQSLHDQGYQVAALVSMYLQWWSTLRYMTREKLKMHRRGARMSCDVQLYTIQWDHIAEPDTCFSHLRAQP